MTYRSRGRSIFEVVLVRDSTFAFANHRNVQESQLQAPSNI